jgi:hypothetical protein
MCQSCSDKSDSSHTWQGSAEPADPGAEEALQDAPYSAEQAAHNGNASRGLSSQFERYNGLITLGNAAQHAEADSQNADVAGATAAAGAVQPPAKRKAPPPPPVHLELSEDDVLAELYEQGLVSEEPAGEPKSFRGGRPPLGMGPYKRVKELYHSQLLTMANWRRYFADKLQEQGFSGTFRADLRPRSRRSKRSKGVLPVDKLFATAVIAAPCQHYVLRPTVSSAPEALCGASRHLSALGCMSGAVYVRPDVVATIVCNLGQSDAACIW